MPTKKKPAPSAAKAAPKAASKAAKAAPAATAAAAAAAPGEPATAPLNREQRRAQKFGKAGKVHQHDAAVPWPENAANPALLAATDGAEDEGSAPKKSPKG